VRQYPLTALILARHATRKIMMKAWLTLIKAPDSRARSVSKALTWRVTATLTTAIIAFIVTGEIGTAVAIGSVEFFMKFVIYYVHERLWLKVR